MQKHYFCLCLSQVKEYESICERIKELQTKNVAEDEFHIVEMNKEVKITLTEDETWVLFELIRRFSDRDKLCNEDQAEERALWNLCCILEKSSHQESDVGYNEFIAQCRERLPDE